MEPLRIDDLSIENLRDEIAELEAQAARLSAMRSHLHHQIDFGFETATTRAREREVSNERNELRRRIDSLKQALRARETA
jgi:chromosome segregation ATPase